MTTDLPQADGKLRRERNHSLFFVSLRALANEEEIFESRILPWQFSSRR
jgi:hypothetical protein